DSRDDEVERRARILRELFGAAGEGLWIEPPFYCDYGTNITLGAKVFFNFNCVVLDPAPVRVGDNVLFGPAAQISTATHPLSAAGRRAGRELARPVEGGSGGWGRGGGGPRPGGRGGGGAGVGARQRV